MYYIDWYRLPMRTINRRELNQKSGKIIDEVMATGEPVEVVTRGVGSVVISRRDESLYEQWTRLGLITPGEGFLADMPRARLSGPIDEVLRDISSDH